MWVGPVRGMDVGDCLGVSISGERVISSLEERVAVGRVRNVVLALNNEGLKVWGASVLAVC